MHVRMAFGIVAALAGSAATAQAQDKQRNSEIYHIFDIRTAAAKSAVTKAAEAGLRSNVSDSDITTPIVMGPPPEKPGRMEIVNALDSKSFGGLAGLMSAGQALQFKQARCDGAIWIANANRRVRGSQQLRLTFCLYPYRDGYQLDVYGIDSKERGGGISAMLGRALAETVVGKAGDWTNKTILDVVRSIRNQTQATISYVEGQPEFTGTPWEENDALLPHATEREAR